MKHTFKTEGELWRYNSEKAAWFFITINKALSEDIKALCERGSGWGQVKVEVTIGQTTWLTSIFPEKKGTFLLPVKASVRKAENIKEGDLVKVTLTSMESL